MAEISDSIQTNAEGPKQASNATESVQQHPLPDQIAADRYLAARTATRQKKLGIKFTKISPPGAV